MSAIYGRVGPSRPEGFKDLFESCYQKKYKIDKYSFYEKEGPLFCSFGECLQYITPESTEELLPLSEGGLVFTADAILDNREYVADKIASLSSGNPTGISSSTPDGSLMFKLIQRLPQDTAIHFLGLFSYALFDEKKRRLTLTVDQTSQRCLYYYQDADQVVFSTIIAPLTKWCAPVSLSQDYLKDFLAAPGLMPNIQSDLSPFSNIFMVNPGSQVHFDFTDTGIKKTEEYYIDWTSGRGIIDGAIGKFPPHLHVEDYLKDFRRIYSECVASACRSKDNVALSLSSGFDSSSVGVLAAKELQTKSKKLYTFTYVPYEKAASDRNRNNIHNETEYVKEIGLMYPNMEQEFINNSGKNCLEELQEITNALELPIKAVANMPSLFELFRKARGKDCSIVMTGQTGNATVSCGYIDNILFDLYLHHRYTKLIRYLFKFSEDVGESKKKALSGVFRMCKSEKDILKKYKVGQTTLPLSLYDWIKASAFSDYDLAARFKLSGADVSGQSLSHRESARNFMTLKACHSYLGAYETKAGLYNGVVLRDPTRDPRIIWFCYNLPYHLYAHKGCTRWLIREGMKDMLPASITKNQLRYGVQNSDCGRRLIRDAKQLNQLMDHQKNLALKNEKSTLDDLIFPDKLPSLPENSDYELSQGEEVELLTAFSLLTFMNVEI